jgi:hypothetical protein
MTPGAQVVPVVAHDGSDGSASPTVVQFDRSADLMIWMFPPAELVAYP